MNVQKGFLKSLDLHCLLKFTKEGTNYMSLGENSTTTLVSSITRKVLSHVNTHQDSNGGVTWRIPFTDGLGGQTTSWKKTSPSASPVPDHFGPEGHNWHLELGPSINSHHVISPVLSQFQLHVAPIAISGWASRAAPYRVCCNSQI